MATITTIQSTDVISSSRTDLNTNFSNLNTDKIETSYLDTDTALTANSDSKIATQKAVKAYVDSGGNPNASTTQRGIVEEATQSELTAGTETGLTGARLFLNPVHTVSTSAGSGDSGKIARLNASGQFDSSFLNIPSPFITQDIIFASGSVSSLSNNQQAICSNITGTVLYLANDFAGTTATINRYELDSSTGNYKLTHTTTLTVTSSGFKGMAVVGSYLYAVATIGGADSLRRYLASDLSGVTSMTFSGTSRTGPCFSDDTDLYIYSGANSFDRFTISGTTATNAATVTYTSAGSTPLSATCNGTNVWITDQNISGSTTCNIRKYAKTGGAVVSTTTFLWLQNAYNGYPNSCGPGLFIGGASKLGLGTFFLTSSATANVNTSFHATAITLP